ncbi:MAG: acyl carrier protein [Desulfuromonadaceae bacterium]
MKEDLYSTIRSIVAEIAEIEEDVIGDDTHLVDELDMDSMMGLQMLAVLEKVYSIRISNEKLVNFTSVASTARVVEEAIG